MDKNHVRASVSRRSSATSLLLISVLTVFLLNSAPALAKSSGSSGGFFASVAKAVSSVVTSVAKAVVSVVTTVAKAVVSAVTTVAKAVASIFSSSSSSSSKSSGGTTYTSGGGSSGGGSSGGGSSGGGSSGGGSNGGSSGGGSSGGGSSGGGSSGGSSGGGSSGGGGSIITPILPKIFVSALNPFGSVKGANVPVANNPLAGMAGMATLSLIGGLGALGYAVANRNSIGSSLGNAFDGAMNTLGKIGSGFYQSASDFVGEAGSFLGSAGNGLKNAFNGFVNDPVGSIKSAANTAGNVLGTIVNGTAYAITHPVQTLETIANVAGSAISAYGNALLTDPIGTLAKTGMVVGGIVITVATLGVGAPAGAAMIGTALVAGGALTLAGKDAYQYANASTPEELTELAKANSEDMLWFATAPLSFIGLGEANTVKPGVNGLLKSGLKPKEIEELIQMGANKVEVVPGKMKYLLELDAGKAKGFAKIGFDKAGKAELEKLLTSQLKDLSKATTETTEYGVKYTIENVVVGPNGAKSKITTVWQIDHGSDTIRFITAIPEPFA